ncbi:MAG: hypothetical protein GY737_29860 [Desulfobacteraceae bacterium]|nr:hypothetical protein [Desulfobacteraceae bacterium]
MATATVVAVTINAALEVVDAKAAMTTKVLRVAERRKGGKHLNKEKTKARTTLRQLRE